MLTDVVIANKSYTKLKLEKECKTDTIALQVVRQDCPDFLLPMKIVEIDGEREIRYELQEGIRLSYMPKAMSKKDFIVMAVNMLIPFKVCNDWFLDYHNFLLDENYILVGRNGQSIKYVYLPSRDYSNSDERIKDFFTTILLKTDISDDPGSMVSALRMIKNPDSNLMTLLDYFQQQSAAEAKPVYSAPNLTSHAVQEKKEENSGQQLPKPREQKTERDEKPERSKGITEVKAFGKNDDEGRLIGNLFGDGEESRKEKTSKRGGLFGWMKGKSKEEKKEKPVDLTEEGKRTKPAVRGNQEQEYLQNLTVPPVELEDATTIVEYEEEENDNSVLKLRLEDCVGCSCPKHIEIDLHNGFVTVGRKNKNGELQSDFNFDPAISFVSRRHFRIEKSDRYWKIIDLESGNGTFLNGMRLPPNIPQPLCPGDQIMISCNKRHLIYRVCQ